MFKEGDVVCFLGDSLTAAGSWEAEVFQHYRSIFNIKFYNCGVSGATACLASDYLYSLCLSKNPTHVVVMFGANDIAKEAYSPSYTAPDKYTRIADALNTHAEKMERIINDCLDFGCTVTLCTTLPYDEVNESKTENLMCQKGLDDCADIVFSLASKYSLRVIDFRKYFLPMLSTLKPISADRQHPTQHGYHIMAQIFLYEAGMIDKLDYDTPFVIEKWNQERQSIEKTLKLLDFIDYVWLYRESIEKSWTTSEKIEKCRELLENESDVLGYFALCYKAYIAHARKKDALIGELTRRTVRPY